MNGYKAYTRKGKWALINGKYIKLSPAIKGVFNPRNPGHIKAGIGRQIDRFPA